ncbi:hypothetical protein IV203_017900 [Nitzschia inconspicua]|uniref:Uncharacterized protein n=1 Tax=Nitzschia inconspicua TaxID=303405 RepID=A0A9K3Q5E5_9STRA|nr:hypothetical protein IV203_017900 [Nitzschia inconspicua]
MFATNFSAFFLSLIAVFAAGGLPPTCEGYSLQMSATSSSSPKAFKPIKTKAISSTKLFYTNEATSASTTALASSVSVSRSCRSNPKFDPVQAIAFLNDPTRKYKKRSRTRFLSDLDRERRVLTKAAAKAQAKANFEFGQRAAQRAIQSVLKEHGIDDSFITP